MAQAKKAINEGVDAGEEKEEYFKQVTIDVNIMREGLENLLKNKYKIEVRVLRNQNGSMDVRAFAHSKKEMLRFEKFLKDVNTSKIVMREVVNLFVEEE